MFVYTFWPWVFNWIVDTAPGIHGPSWIQPLASMAPVAQISLICFIVMGMLRREINYIQGYLYRIQYKELQKYPVSVTVVEPHAYYCNLYLSIGAPDTKTYFCCCGNAGTRYSTVHTICIQDTRPSHIWETDFYIGYVQQKQQLF